MLAQNIVIVRTAEEPVSAIAQGMANMREWLDQRRILLVDFGLVSLGSGRIAFEARFRDSTEADLFRAAFG